MKRCFGLASMLAAMVGFACGSAATSPGVPTGVSATLISVADLRVAWEAPTDGTRVAGYRLYREGSALSYDGQATSYDDYTLAMNKTYCYSVLAYDAAGNESAPSQQACATTGTNGYLLVVMTNGTGAGLVTSLPGIHCGTDCNEAYVLFTYVSLTAVPASGSSFVAWSGCDTASGTTCTKEMYEYTTVTATFDATVASTDPATPRWPAGSPNDR